MTLPDDETLAGENFAAWETIMCSGPDKETVDKVLSLILDDHLIFEVKQKTKHIWKLTITAMEHVDCRVRAEAVWSREFGPFLVESQAWRYAEEYLHHVCASAHIPFRFVRHDN